MVLILRDGEHIVPRGDTRIQTGDMLMILGTDKVLEQTALLLPEAD